MATTATTKKSPAAKITPRKNAAKAEVVAAVKTPRKAVTAKVQAVLKDGTSITAPKAVPKPATMATVAKATLKLFVLLQGARPTSGPRLVSHTQAALEVLGLAEGHTVRKNALVSVIGPRAVGYHLEGTNFDEKGGAVSLTPRGKREFELRTKGKTYDPKLTAAFKTMFLKGKGTPAYSIHEDNLVQVGLTLR